MIQKIFDQNPPDDPIKHVAVREAANLRPGGFGLLLAQMMIDEVIYNEQGNEVMLIKHLDATQAEGA